MNPGQKDFLRQISDHLGAGQLGPFAAALLFALAGLLALAFALVAIRARREKIDSGLLAFLVARHRLRDHEREALLSVAQRRGLDPPFLILVDGGVFAKHAEAVRARLLERLQDPAQADETLADLKDRLFR